MGLGLGLEVGLGLELRLGSGLDLAREGHMLVSTQELKSSRHLG